MFSATWDEGAIEHAVADLAASLDEEMLVAADKCAEVIASEAKGRHAYTNRTGDLEASTAPGQATGSFLDGTLRGEVVADMPYGEYVELRWSGRYAFLGPANDRTQDRQSRTLDDRLRAAVRRTRGWSNG